MPDIDLNLFVSGVMGLLSGGVMVAWIQRGKTASESRLADAQAQEIEARIRKALAGELEDCHKRHDALNREFEEYRTETERRLRRMQAELDGCKGRVLAHEAE